MNNDLDTLKTIQSKLEKLSIPFQTEYSPNELKQLINAANYTISPREGLKNLSRDLERLLPVPKESMASINKFDAILGKSINAISKN